MIATLTILDAIADPNILGDTLSPAQEAAFKRNLGSGHAPDDASAPQGRTRSRRIAENVPFQPHPDDSGSKSSGMCREFWRLFVTCLATSSNDLPRIPKAARSGWGNNGNPCNGGMPATAIKALGE